MNTRLGLGLAALAASVGVGTAQQGQVQFAKPTTSAPPAAAKPGSTEFKTDGPVSADPKTLDVPADVQAKAVELVRKLGNPVYRERESATRELAKLGRFALPALVEAIRTSDEPEVVERAESLLNKAQALDMKARVSCFLADAEGKFEHTLPGWEKFKETAGNTKPSRELFAEALKNKQTHQMLLAAERGPDEASAVLGSYISKISGYYNNRWGGGYEQPTTPKTADLLIALFLESQFSDKELVVTMPFQWGGGGYYTVANNLYSSTDFSSAMRQSPSGKHADPIRKVLLKWMDTRETTQGCNQAWNFATNMLGRKNALKYAVKVLAGEGGPNGAHIKQNVLMQMGSEGAKDLVPEIAKCFDDTSLLWDANNGGNPNHDIQVRDYALAVALQLTDQKPKDYGFDTTQPNASGKNWNYTTFYFKDERDDKERGLMPGGRFGRAVRVVEDVKKEEEKKKKEEEEKKKKEEEEKKDGKPKKATADDKRKVAFKKWADWAADNIKEGKLVEQPKKEEPKKDAVKPTDTKKEEPKPADAKKEEPKPADAKKEEPKPADTKKEEVKKEEKK